MNELVSRMEKMPSTMALHNNVDGADTRFFTISGPLVNNPMEKCREKIRRGVYQEYNEDKSWAYKPI